MAALRRSSPFSMIQRAVSYLKVAMGRELTRAGGDLPGHNTDSNSSRPAGLPDVDQDPFP